MKKFTLLSAVAAVGLLGMSASATIPAGFESVKVKATIQVQNGDKPEKIKVTTDDMLYLIDLEYGTSYSKYDGGSGYQLVSDGLGSGQLAVVDKTGTIVLMDASGNGDDYYLDLNPYIFDYVYSGSGDKDTYTIAAGVLEYNSRDDNDSFTIIGPMTSKVDWSTYDENYKMKNGSGTIEFDDTLSKYGTSFHGIITGASVSGSGKDVDYPFDY